MNQNLSDALLAAIIHPEIKEQLDKFNLKLDYSDSFDVIYKSPDSKMKLLISRCSFTGFRVCINDIEQVFNVSKEQIKDFIK